jgi:hypothetical protein
MATLTKRDIKFLDSFPLSEIKKTLKMDGNYIQFAKMPNMPTTYFDPRENVKPSTIKYKEFHKKEFHKKEFHKKDIVKYVEYKQKNKIFITIPWNYIKKGAIVGKKKGPKCDENGQYCLDI